MIEISVEIGQTSKTLIIDILRPNVTRAHLVTYTAGATNNKKLSKKKSTHGMIAKQTNGNWIRLRFFATESAVLRDYAFHFGV